MERLTNLALGTLLAAAFLTGWASFAVGTPSGAWIVVAHGILGLGLLVLTPWKLPIVRRGLRRRRQGRWLSVGLAVFSLLAVASGMVLAAGGPPGVAGVTTMQIHVGAAVGSLLTLAPHVRNRPSARLDRGRRAFLQTGTMAVGAALLWLGWEAGFGAERRFTGSVERGSFDASQMPVVQWLDDPVPRLDPSRPEVRIGGLAVQLGPPAERVRSVLDCTGGWFAHQVWGGHRLSELVDPGGARSIVVRSVTGYARRLPVRDLDRLWLVTEVGGRPLSHGHGAPVRLVAPGRRGFWWVKWVESVEPSALPWWVQSPFPLT